VTDGESEDRACDEVICTRSDESGLRKVNKVRLTRRLKKGADSTGKIMDRKEWLVVCNEEDTDGRARVTTNEEQCLHVHLSPVF